MGLSGGNVDTVRAVLRSSCRHSVVRKSPTNETPNNAYRAEASYRITLMDINTSKQKFPREESVYWPDRIVAALLGNKYSMEIRFDSPDESLLSPPP